MSEGPAVRCELRLPFLGAFCAQLLAVPVIGADAPAAVEVLPSDVQSLRYRLVGPFRGGRTVGAVGVPTQPGVFYVGVNNGGVWKTDDYGRTWHPIFDDAPTGSVGDLAVAPSDPDVIYVGTGEGLHRPDLAVGDGIFRSGDGGAHWQHVGLADVQQVARLIVHPTDPQTVFVAGLGHPYGPNEQRGVFRTRDGGAQWERVLYVDADTGAIQVEFDPSDPSIVYASLWQHRDGPWENADFSGPNSGLYRSDDGGDSWRSLDKGLPGAKQGVGRIGVGIAPSRPTRVYATVGAREGSGVYRSDDRGESWRRVSEDERVWGRPGDFGEIRVHPQNPDVVFAGNIAAYRSEDGGESWTSIKGAPGGDDYHRIWIHPSEPDTMLFAADQGATITVNGGRTWSSWYNQPTSQLYHVTTDNQFPYWIYGGQQESGAIAIASRGNGGQITFREFLGVGADEYAYVAPDPRNPDIVYGGRVVRFDRRTGQTRNVAPEALRSGEVRVLRTQPLMFHPADPTMLLYATNLLWRTHDGGQHWETLSPDLSRPHPAVPPSVGVYRKEEMDSMARRGVIYALAPSPRDRQVLWAGTDDGLIHRTEDLGRSWQNVTPPTLRSWDKVSQLDAGHFDRATAYAAINAIRRDDQRPYVYRTHDRGETWQLIVFGLPASGPVNVVREDPKQPGLLFAGTERGVYVSIDDGDHWQPLRLNMPASSVRDLVVHENDLVVGTHGRSIWVLDDIAPLRSLSAAKAAQGPYLFPPSLAVRVRWNMFSDTPLPPEEPTGQNPPDGAIVDYYLDRAAERVTLEILDGRGALVRRYDSALLPLPVDPASLPHPTYWIRKSKPLAVAAGHQRFVWDLRFSEPPGVTRRFDIAAVYQQTPVGPVGPWVAPGTYTVRLTVDGQVREQPLTVTLDPRVRVNEDEVAAQTESSLRAFHAYHRAQDLRRRIDAGLPDASAARGHALRLLRGEGQAKVTDITYGSVYAVAKEEETVVSLQGKLLYLLQLFQAADARPTAAAVRALKAMERRTLELEERFETLESPADGADR
ncbi:MAG: glycoside hydrolase [Pseudomonadota bacterium]